MSNSGYPGQRKVVDAADMHASLQFAMRIFSGKMFTAIPVQVQSITGGGVGAIGRVDILPLINQIDIQMNATPHDTVFNVPYFRYQGGASALIVDPAVNDIGLAVCSSRDASAVKRTLKQSNPGSMRRFSLSDSFYFGCVLTGSAPTDYIQALPDGGFTAADRFGNSWAMDASGITINGILFPRGSSSFNIKTHYHVGSSPTNKPVDGS